MDVANKPLMNPDGLHVTLGYKQSDIWNVDRKRTVDIVTFIAIKKSGQKPLKLIIGIGGNL